MTRRWGGARGMARMATVMAGGGLLPLLAAMAWAQAPPGQAPLGQAPATRNAGAHGAEVGSMAALQGLDWAIRAAQLQLMSQQLGAGGAGEAGAGAGAGGGAGGGAAAASRQLRAQADQCWAAAAQVFGEPGRAGPAPEGSGGLFVACQSYAATLRSLCRSGSSSAADVAAITLVNNAVSEQCDRWKAEHAGTAGGLAGLSAQFQSVAENGSNFLAQYAQGDGATRPVAAGTPSIGGLATQARAILGALSGSAAAGTTPASAPEPR
jgi:hypothetical protein